ncbi:hypothetical protein DSECCO2_559900 [anaerobic digester metagenome]
MRKILPAFLLIIVILAFSQCKKDDETHILITTIDTKGRPVANIPVYMFDASLSETTFNRPSQSLFSALTNSEGVADFSLNDIQGSAPIYRQTMLCFVVFDDKNEIAGKIQLLVTEGKNTRVTMIVNRPEADIN